MQILEYTETYKYLTYFCLFFSTYYICIYSSIYRVLFFLVNITIQTSSAHESSL